MDKADALSKIACFSELPRSLIDTLAGLSGVQRIGKGSTLFREGERAHFVYALIEGSVSLLNGPDREETIADFMDAGELILVPPALLGLPYMVTAKAVTDLLVFLIPVKEFRHLAETELPLSTALNRMLAGHWRLLIRHLTQTKSRNADTRVAQYLLDAAAAVEDAAHITLPGSKRDLAAHLGMTPETLSRSLKRLDSFGIKTAGRSIKIESVSRLGRLLRHHGFASFQSATETSVT